MRQFITRFMILGAGLAFYAPTAMAQHICMVTADYQDAENYIVMWEELADVSNIDSIFIYRKEGVETVFTKIGAVDVTLTSPTYFVDTDVNTMDTTKYAISYLFTSGVESARSPWHQAVVMDYDDATGGEGHFFWTKYKKEDQVDESYIEGYVCNIDQSGLGLFSNAGFWGNQTTDWIDQSHMEHPGAHYEILVQLPDCNVLTKANINTSRSNIKNQQSNQAVMEEEEQSAGISLIQGVHFTLSPNPVVDVLTISANESFEGSYWITNVKGEKVDAKPLSGNSLSLDISSFESGVYFFNLESKGIVSSKKFVKK